MLKKIFIYTLSSPEPLHAGVLEPPLCYAIVGLNSRWLWQVKYDDIMTDKTNVASTQSGCS